MLELQICKHMSSGFWTLNNLMMLVHDIVQVQPVVFRRYPLTVIWMRVLTIPVKSESETQSPPPR